MTNKPKHIDGTLDDFLKEEGIYEEVCLRAAKKTLALKLQREMKKRRVTKSTMARRMHTSRAAVNRLLNPDIVAVELSTITKAAIALGKELTIALR
jgi:hypothetical protein